MKPALSLTIVACLGGFASPLAAQERVADGGWSRVGNLPPGSEIIVTVRGSAPAKRYLMSSDDSGLTVLNLAQGVEGIARADIADIKTPIPHSPTRDAMKGFLVGGAGYGVIGASVCKAFGGTGSCAGDVMKVAALGGSITAGISLAAGAIKHRIKPWRVIYRAP